MIQLKSAREIETMAAGGRILAGALAAMARAVRPGATTGELDDIGADYLRSYPGALASFKGLYGFPRSACISINEEIVHGIPNAKRVLAAGDIVSLDFGVKYLGFYTDAAITVGVGEVDEGSQRLMEVTRAALDAGVCAAQPGAHVGDIGAAIQAVVRSAGYTTADDLVGHYVGYEPHGEPQVPNNGKPRRGLKLAPGLTIAIEPMVNAGTSRTKTLKDRWTIVTADGRRSAHFEHTVAITESGPRILTAGENGEEQTCRKTA
ncbi:MAG: type I methionyl aminopeptidase [Gemmatimonadaceae bacterium]